MPSRNAPITRVKPESGEPAFPLPGWRSEPIISTRPQAHRPPGPGERRCELNPRRFNTITEERGHFHAGLHNVDGQGVAKDNAPKGANISALPILLQQFNRQALTGTEARQNA